MGIFKSCPHLKQNESTMISHMLGCVLNWSVSLIHSGVSTLRNGLISTMNKMLHHLFMWKTAPLIMVNPAGHVWLLGLLFLHLWARNHAPLSRWCIRFNLSQVQVLRVSWPLTVMLQSTSHPISFQPTCTYMYNWLLHSLDKYIVWRKDWPTCTCAVYAHVLYVGVVILQGCLCNLQIKSWFCAKDNFSSHSLSVIFAWLFLSQSESRVREGGSVILSS